MSSVQTFDVFVKRRIQQVEDAYLQQDLMRPHWADKARSAEARYYAVGADVVMMYADPRENAMRRGQERAIGYGEIFRHDETAVKKAIVSVLGHYLFFSLTPGAPLLVLPPVARQLARILSDLSAVAENERLSIDSYNYEKLRAALTKDGRALAPATANALRRAHLLDGPLSKLQRVNQLFGEERVVNIAKAGDIDRMDPPLAKALKAVRDQDAGLLDGLSGNLARLMREIGGRDNDNARAAAEAMAYVEAINRRLGENGRLIYITGDTSISRVGEFYRPEGATDNFTSAFVRHPRAYLDEPGALRSPKAAHDPREPSLADTLTLWLGHFTDYPEPEKQGSARRVLAPAVQQRIAQLQQSDPTGLQEAQDSWRKLAEAASPRYVRPNYLETLLKELAHGVEQVERKLAELEAGIDANYQKAFDSFFDSIVITRIALEFPGRPPSRERPSLCFERADHSITELFRKATEYWRQNKALSVQEYKAYRAGILAGEGADYFINLANAWLLASQGHWKSAAILAERACAFARQTIGMPVEHNGREAHYLWAVCLRYVAERSTDKYAALGHVSDFVRIAQAERDAAAGRALSHDIVIERANAERIAAELVGIWFDYFENPQAQREIGATLLSEADRIITDLVGQVTANIDLMGPETADGGSQLDMPSWKHRYAMRRQIVRQAWRHVISIDLTIGGADLKYAERGWNEIRPPFGEALLPQPIWRNAQADTRRGRRPLSGFSELQDMCCIGLFDLNKAARKFVLCELKLLRPVLKVAAELPKDGTRAAAHAYPDFDLSRLLVHPFDAQRFGRWIDVVLQASPA